MSSYLKIRVTSLPSGMMAVQSPFHCVLLLAFFWEVAVGIRIASSAENELQRSNRQRTSVLPFDYNYENGRRLPDLVRRETDCYFTKSCESTSPNIGKRPVNPALDINRRQSFFTDSTKQSMANLGKRFNPSSDWVWLKENAERTKKGTFFTQSQQHGVPYLGKREIRRTKEC